MVYLPNIDSELKFHEEQSEQYCRLFKHSLRFNSSKYYITCALCLLIIIRFYIFFGPVIEGCVQLFEHTPSVKVS